MAKSAAAAAATGSTDPLDYTMRNVATQLDAQIDVSAQLISMEPGLFTIKVIAPREVRTEGGMVLPCVRLDPLPRMGREQAYVSVLSDTSLLTPSSASAYLRVADGRTSVLLTTYKVSGPMPPPEIHINVVEENARQPIKPVAVSQDALPSAAITVMVHVQNHGDLRFPGGAWAASANGDGNIEGFSIAVGEDLPSEAIEYQAVLGQDWFTPWMTNGEFCGSRQMALPLLGVLVRLQGQAATDFVCQVWGRFTGIELGPFEDGAPCKSDGAPLTGLRIALIPRPAEVTPSYTTEADTAAGAPSARKRL